ncbi:SDR family NAD(P)-dependent oxidoreductase [Streptococcus cuniculipharyngis]|uniref:SDR family oxidoreductase n=1 Tax=Streptococcus cuniculipharyngis TaxID=1562651 RepID=A0A5C5SCW3_9STRE|nr:SDR family oxidoreductase [Streptococcus cuniculipharyngis]TWS98020.1 SDR family oxidoreductase [Streptococcus cuniculipharyngis]
MRRILMTGASGDLAQAIINRLGQSDQIIAVGRSQERLAQLYGQKSNVTCYALDITDQQAVEIFLAQLLETYGNIDMLINNAGFGQFKSFEAFDEAEIKEMFEVNALASIRFCRLLGQHMAEQGQGHLVNIASMAGLIATSKSTIYSATKFALIGFSNALRLELADKGVYVTTVNPGPIVTKFFDQADPEGHYLQQVKAYALTPEQVADKIVKCLGKNKRELNLPWLLALAHKLYTLFPRLADYLAGRTFNYK